MQLFRSHSLVAVLLAALVLSGCRTARDSAIIGRQGQVVLPLWFTTPSGAEHLCAPVDIGMKLPKHLQQLGEKYGQPGWVVYGVVRALGAKEFLANGTVKTFTVKDEGGESRVVVDDVYYDVDRTEVESVLRSMADAGMNAETELDRINALGRHVVRRYGGFVLFSLAGNAPDSENLLLTTGEGRDPVEVFHADTTDGFPEVGWKETRSHYVTTLAGEFRYGDPVGAFRRTEEAAISDLAKGLVLKFSHMSKSYSDSKTSVEGDIREDTMREEIKLRMRGVRVVRRIVNLRMGHCFVVVQVPRDGVALR